jgi:aryl-alcohol dehydrogenase-like predicted oxidoreductase
VLAISSKWGYTYTADWQVDADPPEVKDLSVHTLRRQVAETRSWLGPWLTLYQIHSATVSSGVLDDDEVLEELAFLREGGVEVGFTASGTDQGETIDLALERGGFDSVQATYNLLERSAEPALERARAAGLRVMVKEAVANGRLTPRGGCAPLEAVARRLGVTSDAVALGFVLSRPWVDVVLSGASTIEQLRSNLGALELDWSAELDEELAGLAEPSEDYWSARSALSWT